MKPYEESYALRSSTPRIQSFDKWRMGDVLTPWGIVSVYTEERATIYGVVHDGRHHMRTENRTRTNRGIAIEAAKFAKRVVSGDAP